ncbi:hypothetical protein QBC46DRAFT_401047 [Diplogelasinospora grovesii]|uniref:Protein kinase domain-containing protein n=1 Tax=Diplogelasinospora grovesii TaxID=303347 RepID=A0AAN6MW00_9PEZI|nr:hypothetical protein QBC46DRAFT_401047 [Diplogelasinospora grovesii]
MYEPEDVTDRQRYLISSYAYSNEDKDSDWFRLAIRLNGREFHLQVSLSEFHNSPSKTQQFQEYLACLRAGDEDDDEENSDKEMSESAVNIMDCFSWAVDPHLEQFESLAPPLADISTLTLQDFFHSASFECELGAVNDRFVLGPIERRENESEEMWPPGHDPEDDDPPEASPWTTTFPSFRADQVRVLCDSRSDILNTSPTKVAVDGQTFYFKAVQPPGDKVGKREVQVYEQIVRAGFGSHVRTSRLYGVVLDENQQLMGLLLYPIAIDDTLEYALENPGTKKSSKKRWAKQIKATLGALHEHGIVWGDAKPDNIVINVHGDAWIIDFGGGHTRGWVDKAKYETIQGDLQGLENILEFISTGRIVESP